MTESSGAHSPVRGSAGPRLGADASRDRQRLANRLVPAVLTLYLLSVTLGASTVRHAAPMIVLLAVLFALLAIALTAGVLLASRLARPLGLLAALAAGCVLVWHSRESLEVPVGRGAFVLWSAGCGLLLFLVLVRGASRVAPLRSAAALAGAALLLAGGLVASYEASGAVRWTLLRHVKLFGTPLYYALSEPVEQVRRELWESHGGKGAAASPRIPVATSAVSEEPDLVFVLVDTLRADALAAYGGPPDLMPEVNRLAEASFVFEDVLGNATWTRPSVASLFTGLLPEEHGAIDREDSLPAERVTLAALLADRGYDTAAFVANWGAVGRESGFARGFSHFAEVAGGSDPYARAEQMNREVAEWLRSRRGSAAADAPLFLYVHYLDPHTPYLSGGPTPRTSTEGRQAYDQELRYVDGAVRALVELLDRERHRPRYLFFTSDHGEEFWEHGEGGHGHSLYPEVLRLPALLQTPRGARGRIASPLEARDFFTLLLRVAGTPDLDVSAWAERRSRETRYASVYGTTASMGVHRPYLRYVAMRAVDRDGLLLIWSGYGDTRELYDLDRDPGARSNLSSRMPERVPELMTALEQATPRRWSRRVKVQHGDETHELLKVLGYVE